MDQAPSDEPPDLSPEDFRQIVEVFRQLLQWRSEQGAD